MKIIKVNINNLLLIQPDVFEDSRGYFYETYNKGKFSDLGINVDFLQDNQSLSGKGVLRGLHFQNPPYAQGKLVRVIKGSVLDVAVDIRKKSSTYGQHYKHELNEKNRTMMWIPPGFAHGFLTLEDETIFSYKCTNVYNKLSEGTIQWNDEDLKIDWQIKDPIISEKDKVGTPFKQFESMF
jgi:dTDP-4-dehydrorhamnose 3,5-epimerase